MIGKGNGQSARYRVHMSARTAAAVEHLHHDAMIAGTSQQFIDAFSQIFVRLRDEPGNFGEPLYRLPALQLQVRQAVILPLMVVFGVHEEQPLVFIRGFKVMS